MKYFKKKFAKKLSLLVTLAMLISLMAGMTVFAAEPDTTTITGTEGSITVHKYVTTSGKNVEEASGTEKDEDSITTDNYQSLEGAKFKLYKINEIDAKTYFNGDDDTEVTIDTVAENGTAVGSTGYYVHGNNGSGKVDLTLASDTTKMEQTTDEDGECSFDGLELGIYVLVEMEAPSYVSTPYSEPCLISIPMVNTATSTNENAWIYDVNVYPKNFDTAKLVLTKNDDDGTALEGVTFELYKKEIQEDGTYKPADSWDKVTIKNASDEVVPFTTDADGKITIDKLTSGQYGTQYKLVEISAPSAYIVNKYPIYFTVNKNSTITYNDAVTDGVYQDEDCIKSNKYVNGNHDVTEENITMYPATLDVTLRNARPWLTKYVKQNPDDGTTWVSDTQYALSEEFTYQIQAYVPKNIAEISYVITDTPDAGITDGDVTTAGNYVIKYKDGDAWKELPAGNYELKQVAATAATGQGFTFELTEAGKTLVAGKEIEIVYKANLNEEAVIAGSGNNSTAKLEYSEYIDGTATSDDIFEISDAAVVYTYKFKITKYMDSVAAANVLKPSNDETVKFNLYEADKTTKLEVVEITSGTKGLYRIPYAGETYTAITDLELSADGTIEVEGLERGTYYLKEIQTITGYNLLADFVEINLNIDETTAWTDDTGYVATGRVVKEYEGTTYTLKTGDTTTVTLTTDSSDPATSTTREVDIINKKGFTLPKTGSMGFLAFCVIGLALVAGGAALMFSGRKKKIR